MTDETRYKKVYKYQGYLDSTLMLPLDSNIVHALPDMDRGILTIWAEVDHPDSGHQEQRNLRVVGTGHVIPDSWEHIATSVQPPYVWHVYEKPSA